MNQDTHLVFISYASPDQSRVIPFYDFLEREGFNPWIDCRKLKPGHNWDFEIKRALDKATFVLFFVSNISHDRRGYLQRELKLVLDKMSEKLIDDIYLIPVLLDDDAKLPDQLRSIQHIRASGSDAKDQIAEALRLQLEKLGARRVESQKKGEITWVSRIIRESWDGIPGYEVELEHLEFSSTKYPNVSQISDYIKGKLLLDLFEHRGQKLWQSPFIFNYTQDPPTRTNTYDAHCGEPVIVGKVVTIHYGVSTYGAGAAHPNHFFQTYAFLLDPVILIEALSEIFEDRDKAFAMVQREARQALSRIEITYGSNDREISKLDSELIAEGTKTWEDFSAFVFDQSGVELLFRPYQVASYANGPQSIQVPYEIIAPMMRREYVDALQILRFVR